MSPRAVKTKWWRLIRHYVLGLVRVGKVLLGLIRVGKVLLGLVRVGKVLLGLPSLVIY